MSQAEEEAKLEQLAKKHTRTRETTWDMANGKLKNIVIQERGNPEIKRPSRLAKKPPASA